MVSVKVELLHQEVHFTVFVDVVGYQHHRVQAGVLSYLREAIVALEGLLDLEGALA